MQNEEISYLEYFNFLFSEKINLTADISLSYSGLTKERLEFISNLSIEKNQCKGYYFYQRSFNTD